MGETPDDSAPSYFVRCPPSGSTAQRSGFLRQRTNEDTAVIDLEWQLQRVGGHPLTHKQVLKADGSTDTLPLPPICSTALRIAKRNQDQARKDAWPDTCICGEKHTLVFTTRTGHPNEPRNINRAFDVRCARYGVRRITLHDTRRTCGSLLAALDVHPRIAMAILRHSRIALTMEIYAQIPDKVTRDALTRLGDWQTRQTMPPREPGCCTPLLYGHG